ncbi:MAG: hypothetical protein L3J21_08095, partial [Devosiaceae bacterium]|nr:hypothetical protein [Devosiaceae bacterium]
RARLGRTYAASTRDKPPALLQLSPLKQALCIIACVLPLLAGLGIPVFVLAVYALRRIDGLLDPVLFSAATSSIWVAFLSATLATTIAYGVLQYGRITKSAKISTIGRIASLGYAVPGTVLAVGLLVALAGFDNWLDGLMRSSFGISTGLMFSGSIMIIVYACTLRFLAIAYGTLESGFGKISPHIDMAARALGRTPMQTAWQVHRPIMRRALGVAFLLVFVDTMKELSATLLLRPFDFETLATFFYDRASQSALEEPAIAGTILTWQVSNTFDGASLIGNGMLPKDMVSGLSFQALDADVTGITNLAKLQGVAPGQDTVLAKVMINSQSNQMKEFQFGFSDAAKIYLNGQPLFQGSDGESSRDYRFLGTVGYYDTVFLPLKSGENELIIAVSESVALTNGWAVQGRFNDVSGIDF